MLHLSLDIEKIDLKKILYIFLFHNLVKQQILMQALDLCNKNNMKTACIVNVIESSIARDSNFFTNSLWTRNRSCINKGFSWSNACTLYNGFKTIFFKKRYIKKIILIKLKI